MVFYFTFTFVGFSADSVEWPADFENKLTSHINELRPQVAVSATGVFEDFDSLMVTEGVGIMSGVLRNYATPGFLLFFR